MDVSIMITFRASADISSDRRVVLTFPPEIPTGKAELVITVAPQSDDQTSSGSLRRQFGSVRSGDSHSADNERIDADVARAYGDSHD
jgi:hypothetical protein